MFAVPLMPAQNPPCRRCLPGVYRRLAPIALTPLLMAAAPEGVERVALSEALRRAEAAHPDLGPQRARVDLARARLRRARAGAFPRGEIRTVFGVRNGADVGSVPDGLPDALAPLFSPDSQNDLVDDLGPFVRNTVRIDQPLYTFGKIRRGKEAAAAGIDAERQELRRRESEIRLETARTFFGYQLAAELTETFAEVADNFGEAAAQAEARLDSGDGGVTQADLLKLRVARAGLDRRVLELRRRRKEALWAFRRALGRDLDAPVAPAEDRIRPVQVRDLAGVESLTAVAQSSAALDAAEAGLRAREGAVAVAKSQLWPDVFLSVRFEANWAESRADIDNPFLWDEDNLIRGGPFFGLRWKLDVATQLADIQAAEARAAEQAARLERARTGLPLEVRRAFARYEEAEASLSVARTARKTGRALSFTTAANFRLGIGEGREILEAYGLYARTLGEYYRAIFDFNMAVAELSEAVGQPLWVDSEAG